jgi:hypothetical protein
MLVGVVVSVSAAIGCGAIFGVDNRVGVTLSLSPNCKGELGSGEGSGTQSPSSR